MRTSQRQTRTNPARTSRTAVSSLRQSSLISNANAAAAAAAVPPTPAQEHGFYPAITHFTDAIAALPREFRRHTSLLKEVDAKAWAPEAHLQTLLAACVTSQSPVEQQSQEKSSTNPNIPDSNTGENSSGTNKPPGSAESSAQSQPEACLERRKLLFNLRSTLSEIMGSMEEKNHLIYSANEDLSRHVGRLKTIYPHVTGEVSDEARLGSLTHWAYIDNKPSTRPNANSSRRDAAAGLAAMHDTDVASRSESRREAMLARKRNHAVDSDFDDPKPSKRAPVNGKSKKTAETTGSGLGLGISGVPPQGKKKKAEKQTLEALGMERSLSAALGGRAMSREPSQHREGGKKRKAPSSTTAAARKRFVTPTPTDPSRADQNRINTANSAANSPKIASSPLVGTFGKDARRNSPMPGTNPRPQASRARQNSSQRPPSSASIKNTVNGNTEAQGALEHRNSATTTRRPADEVKALKRDLVNDHKNENINEDMGRSVNGTGGLKSGSAALKSVANTLKADDAAGLSEPQAKSKGTSSRLPPPPHINAEREREGRPSRARSSKTTTPIVNTFAESEMGHGHGGRTDSKSKRRQSSSSRSNRAKDPLHDSLSPSGLPAKRSHKKGAGLAAQAAALQAKLAKQSNSNGNPKADTPGSNSTSTPPLSTTGTIDNSHDPHSQPHRRSLSTHTTNNGTHKPGSRTASPSRSKTRGRTHPLLSATEATHTHRSPSAAPSNSSQPDSEHLDSSGEEPRYCFCQRFSYGEMVACDAKACQYEWFHLGCVGLEKAPGRNARWLCFDCREKEKKGKDGSGNTSATGKENGNGNGNSNAEEKKDDKDKDKDKDKPRARADSVRADNTSSTGNGSGSGNGTERERRGTR